MSYFKCGKCGTEIDAVFIHGHHECPDIERAVLAERARVLALYDLLNQSKILMGEFRAAIESGATPKEGA